VAFCLFQTFYNLWYNIAMAPKITKEMREALHRNRGKPVDVEDDDESKVYVLMAKDTFVHLQGMQSDGDEETRQALRSLIQEGIDSGPGIPAEQVFADLRQYAEDLAKRSA
jgi:hypothetical protein